MDGQTHLLAPDGWLEAMERSEAQAVAGQVVRGSKIKADLAASVARLQAKSTTQTGPGASLIQSTG